MADNVLEELKSRAAITLQAKQSGQLPQIDHVKLIQEQDSATAADVRKGVCRNKHSIRHHIRRAHWERFITIIAGGKVKENIRFIAEEYHQLMEDVMKDDSLYVVDVDDDNDEMMDFFYDNVAISD